jgi:hypothetical protein
VPAKGGPLAPGNSASGKRPLIKYRRRVNNTGPAPSRLATLAELREQNKRLARLIRHLQRVYSLGRRPIVELVIELAETTGSMPQLEQLAEQFAERLDREVLRAVGADDFPCSPIRIIAGDRR